MPGRTDRETAAGRWSPILSAAGAAILLTWAVRPAVGVHDSGELASAAWFLGIAHPAGSPLWILLAKGASLLPLAGGPALRIALLSVAATAGTAALATASLERLRTAPLAAAALGLTIVLLPRPFWAGLMIEVYALELFLAVALVIAAWWAAGHHEDTRAPAVAGLVGGLLLAVHHSLLPGVVVALVAAAFAGRRRIHRLAAAAAGLALGLTPYLELPIRAASHPPALWADTTTLAGLWRHLSSAQYRTDSFAGGGGLARLGDALAVTGGPLPWVILPLALAGLIVLWRASRTATVALLSLWAADLAAVVWLQSMPLDSEAYLVVASGLAGLSAAVALAATVRRWPRFAVGTLLIPCLLLPSLANRFDRTAEPARWTVARRLAAAPPGAVLWLRGDSVAFPAVYQQLVEGWRSDVTILHPWGFVGAPWLPESLRSRPGDKSASTERDRLAAAILRRASDEGRMALFQDRVAWGRLLRPRGTLWMDQPGPPLPSAALVSPLPGERALRFDGDPTVRGLAVMDHLPLGFTAAAGGNRTAARREARLAADSQPSFATVHRALGQGWLDLDLVPEAVFELERAVALDPSVPEVWLALGVARIQGGDPEGARTAWLRATALRPGWAPPLVDLARLALRRGKLSEAHHWATLAAAMGDPEGRMLAKRLGVAVPH